jgi:ATP-dependent DNA helicase RecQ
MPDEQRAEAILHNLSDIPLSTPALEARVNIRRTPLELLLKVLDVDGVVRRVQGGWVSTGEPWTYDRDRYEHIAAERVAEQQHMLEYEQTSGCRMEYLQRSLDDETAKPCGRCDNCAGVWYPADVLEAATERAASSLDRVGVPLDPRAQWPTGADRLGVPVKGNIKAEERMLEGRSLARLTDLGWGNTLRELFSPATADAPATHALIAACVRVLADWGWAERPVAVVSVPSRRHPFLVESLSRGLADAGRLTNLGSLDLIGDGPKGEPGGNSAYRLSGVWGAFAVGPTLSAALNETAGPILLVDDLADSRWTLTVAARLLRQAGSGDVLPFALALRG